MHEYQFKKNIMNCAKLLDIYTDYLIVQNSQATATGCSELLDNKIKHDSFTHRTRWS